MRTLSEESAREAAKEKAGRLGGGLETTNRIVDRAETAVQRELLIGLVGVDKYWLMVEALIRAK